MKVNIFLCRIQKRCKLSSVSKIDFSKGDCTQTCHIFNEITLFTHFKMNLIHLEVAISKFSNGINKLFSYLLLLGGLKVKPILKCVFQPLGELYSV